MNEVQHFLSVLRGYSAPFDVDLPMLDNTYI